MGVAYIIYVVTPLELNVLYLVGVLEVFSSFVA